MDFQKIFIVGSCRSGTTWTRRVFLEHPSVIGPRNESKVFKVTGPFIQGHKEFDSQRQEIIDQYDAIPKGARLHRMISREDLLSLIDSLRRQNISQKEKAQALADGIIRNFFKLKGGDAAKIFVEKTPSHLFFVKEILEMYPSAKIICLIRDGRDVCLSLQRASEKGIAWCPRERHLQIKLWKKSAEHYLDLLADPGLSSHLLTVRYEDLRNSPENEFLRMFEFTGVPVQASVVKKWVRENDISLLAGKVATVHKGGIDQWKEEFSEEDHRLFRSLCGDLLVRMGYAQGADPEGDTPVWPERKRPAAAVLARLGLPLFFSGFSKLKTSWRNER